MDKINTVGTCDKINEIDKTTFKSMKSIKEIYCIIPKNSFTLIWVSSILRGGSSNLDQDRDFPLSSNLVSRKRFFQRIVWTPSSEVCTADLLLFNIEVEVQ